MKKKQLYLNFPIIKQITNWAMNNAIYLVLILLLIVITIISPDFLKVNNFRLILTQASTRIIIALGVGGVLITQGTDLSAGRIVGVGAVLSASLLQATDYPYRMYPNLMELPLIIPMLFTMIICACFGFVNGVIVGMFKVPPFIATLGTMIIIYGLNSIYFDRPPLGAQPVGGLAENFTTFVQGDLILGPFEIPYLIIYAVIVIGIIWVLWNQTILGRNMYAIGGNIEAATVSGVSVIKYLLIVYTLAGLLYGFAGVLEAGRVGSATNNTGNMYELDAIAACVVGGVSTSGGIGNVSGVVTGVLIFQIINYGLVFIELSPYLQFIVKGLIIVSAVAIDMRKYVRQS